MQKFIIENEYITLGQFLKVESFISSGGMIKPFLEENVVYLNGAKETKRGKKIYKNDKLQVLDKEYFFV